MKTDNIHIITLSKQLQTEMLKFFVKNSIPRKKTKINSLSNKK